MLPLLPGEIICGITDLLTAQEIAFLWTTGDKRLAERLGNGGGVKNYYLLLDPLYVAGWPSIIRHFTRLETFAAGSDIYTGYSPKWTPNWNDLSPTVHTIRISWTNDFESLLGAMREEGSIPNLRNLSVGNGSSDEMEEFLAKIAPKRHSLRSLELECADIGVLSLALLPPFLVKLNVSITSMDLTSGCAFPATLEELSLSVIDYQDFFGLLPSGLQSLTFYTTNSEINLAPEDFALLPRGLTELRVAIEEITEDHLKALPPALIEFDLGANLTESQFKLMKLLPPTVTASLSLPEMTEESVSFFPRGLREAYNIALNPAVFAQLPPNLKFAGFAHDNPPSTDEEPIQWPQLPNSLTHVTGLLPSYFDHHTLPNLKRVEFHGIFTASQVEKLPWGLEYFASWALIEGTEWIASLPPTLTELDTFFDDEDALGEGVWPTWSLENFQQLPPNLETLCIGPLDQFTGECLTLLPSKLTNLKILTESLDADNMEHLARLLNLRQLNVKVWDTFPTDCRALVKNLPKRLMHFTYQPLRRTVIDLVDDDLKSLPVALMTFALYCDAQFITGSCAPYLPHYLDSFTIDYITPAWFNSLRAPA